MLNEKPPFFTPQSHPRECFVHESEYNALRTELTEAKNEVLKLKTRVATDRLCAAASDNIEESNVLKANNRELLHINQKQKAEIVWLVRQIKFLEATDTNQRDLIEDQKAEINRLCAAVSEATQGSR